MSFHMQQKVVLSVITCHCLVIWTFNLLKSPALWSLFWYLLPCFQCRLGSMLLWNSYRIDLLFPFKMNNSALISYLMAFTTQCFWNWYKIYQIGFTRSWKHAKVQCQHLSRLIFCKALIFTRKSRKHTQNPII